VILGVVKHYYGITIGARRCEMKTTEFSIEERYEFFKTYIDIVLSGEMSSLIISGTAGIGKSWTVKEKTEDLEDVTWIKGFSTARALYDTLYHNRNGLIIFDDCDNLLKDKVAVNIFKGALDSYDERIISWMAKSNDKTIPSQFNFQGRVIFISNLQMTDFDLAMKSRALTIDLTMTFKEKISLMRTINGRNRDSGVDYLTRVIAMNTLVEHAINEDMINLRTLDRALMFARTMPHNYEDQIKFMAMSEA
jgi:hypothetical protein